MARIRMIKPEFFDDPDVSDLSPLARLFFIGLWTQADREGRLQDDPRRLKARLFPYEPVDIEALAVELHGKDMIRRYRDGNGNGFIWIRTFSKHQRPHPKEPASVIAECQPGAGKKNGEPCKNTARTPESGSLDTESGTRKLENGAMLPTVAVAVPSAADAAFAEAKSKEQRTEAEEAPPPPTPPVTARSKRPIFTGQRLTVFEWQLENCLRTLGPHAGGFDLHEWFFALDAKAVEDGIVIPTRGIGDWLIYQLVAEAQRRGLPLKMASVDNPNLYRDSRTIDQQAAAVRALLEEDAKQEPW